MNKNDEKLKAMWNKTENLIGSSEYDSSNIERFLSGRSHSTAQMIKKMIYMDLIMKGVVMIALLVDIILYAGTTNVVAVCISGMVPLAGLAYYQQKMLTRFAEIADHGQTTRDKLVSMLTYLKTRFTSTLISISITYLFIFIAGSLAYFYAVYGMVRPLDWVDIAVFISFILIGLGFNFFTFRAQVQYHIKHLQICLSDLNDKNLELVSENIELQRKRDRTNKLLLLFLLVFGILLLVIVFKNIGFIIK
ncbi:hypothetical protein [uncultured Draconibacterium sp.]|uniref:hypothetical protein n=1 Tax=uncultured Draconibacterium sp. TaxID=1573823 RepID=UPI0029C8F4A7|nr:hypothetical protein [uncultured Draconibacterium sp.]